VFPIVLIATLFGSNQLDMPRQTPWVWLLVGAAVVSAVLLCVFTFIYVRQLPRLKAFEQARREHMLHAASIK
jgi:heme exporter protein D